MTSLTKSLFLALVFVFALIHHTKSQDRVFARTYQSNVLNKGNFDLEVWSTYQYGRDQFYSKLKQRIEFEFGVTDRVQTAFYLNYGQVSSFDKKAKGIKTTSTGISFSNEWKYKMSDPVANRLGFAMYGEFTVSSSEIELEGKLIFDKKIGNEIFALNLVGEAEFEPEADVENGKTKFENEKNKFNIELGWMHLTNKGLGIGIEMENRNAFANSSWKYSALYAGPTVSYHAAKSWWLIFNIMPQITNLHSRDGENLELTSNEKYDMRLLFAYVF